MLNNTAHTIFEQFFYSGLQRLQMSNITKKTKYDFKTVQKYLAELTKQDLIKKHTDLTFPTYEANYRSKYFLITKRNKIVDEIFQSKLPQLLEKQYGDVGCILFGSCARGDFYEDSDIDIFIQHKERKINLKQFENRLNRKINIFFETKWQNLSEGMKTGILNDGVAINDMRDYNQCIKENKIKPIEKLDDRSKEIVALVKHKREFWEKTIKMGEEYPTVLIEAHYELIKELLTAILNKEGFKSETHDCLFYYIEEKHKDLELDFTFLHQLRKARNNIDYRGTKLPRDAWKKMQLKIELTINYLIEYLEK
jgi:predicted nucleotidyltransferase